MSIDNPFFHRGAIRRAKYFLGRETEISQILGLLRNGQSVSLIGPRRIGKSSLLIHLCRPEVRKSFNLQAPNALFVLLDCQELGGSPAEEVYELMLTELFDVATKAGVKCDPINQSGTYRALDRALRQISSQGISVIVLLDEFELLAANKHLTPYFFARLRGLTTKHGLAYLTASQRPLFAITAEEEILSSPFFNIFVTLPLGLFSQEEAQSLLQCRLAETKVVFSPQLNNYLLTLVGPHPFFLHVAGYHAFQAVTQGRLNNGASDSTFLDSTIALEADSHLGYLWQNLSYEEQYAFAIVDGPIDVMRQLVQQCLLILVDGRYRFTSELLRRFVHRQSIEGLIQAGPFVIDQRRHQVWANEKLMPLTNSQFSILTLLCQQSGEVVRGDEIEAAMWGTNRVDDPDRLKTLIKRLRRAIDPYSNWIVSERGVGYTLRSPD